MRPFSFLGFTFFSFLLENMHTLSLAMTKGSGTVDMGVP